MPESSTSRLLRAPHTPPERLAVIAAVDERSRQWRQRPGFRVADYKPFQVLDGDGLRCSLYVGYCLFHCAGCYNKAAQKLSYGVPFTAQLEAQLVADLSRPHVAGLSLVGGEPMLSAVYLAPLIRRLRQRIPRLNVWTYSGYRYEVLDELVDARAELLAETDVLVDGQFIAEERDDTAPPRFAGSSNQRLVDVAASRREGHVVEWAG